jgi:hypothetical protein
MSGYEYGRYRELITCPFKKRFDNYVLFWVAVKVANCPNSVGEKGNLIMANRVGLLVLIAALLAVCSAATPDYTGLLSFLGACSPGCVAQPHPEARRNVLRSMTGVG